MANLFDADYLMKHELVFIGSPDTVAKKIHATAQAGLFNVFMGEFNFSDLPEARPYAFNPPVRRESDSCLALVRAVLTQVIDYGASYCASYCAKLLRQVTGPWPIPDAL